jgi:hypothetical protein
VPGGQRYSEAIDRSGSIQFAAVRDGRHPWPCSFNVLPMSSSTGNADTGAHANSCLNSNPIRIP